MKNTTNTARENFNQQEIKLFSTVEVQSISKPIITLIYYLSGINIEKTCDNDLIQLSSKYILENTHTIQDWLKKLVDQKVNLVYRDNNYESPQITLISGDKRITASDKTIELDYPKGKTVVNASTIIAALNILARLSEEKRTYEPFELENAALLLKINGFQLANFLKEMGKSSLLESSISEENNCFSIDNSELQSN